MSNLKRTPLFEQHLAAGAKLGEFSGWELPMSYADGTLSECHACREDAVVFDVSHLGTLIVSGKDAEAVLQWTLTNDLARIEPGKAQYTHLLDADEGWVIDDIIVWWLDSDLFKVLPNAANTDKVVEILSSATAEAGADISLSDAGASEADLSIQNITTDRALIAIQGPKARERMQSVSAEAASVEHFGVTEFDFNGVKCHAAGTGYTGEDGVECDVPAEVAPAFWEAMLAAGVAPAGLAARDVLRLEAGFPLHGHDLGPDITPVNARLNWVVGWDKPAFRGKDVVVRQREKGVAAHLMGLVGATRRPLREGQSVSWEGKNVGELTSGGFSPLLERGIGLAMLARDVPEAAEVEVGEKSLSARVVKPPFTKLI